MASDPRRGSTTEVHGDVERLVQIGRAENVIIKSDEQTFLKFLELSTASRRKSWRPLSVFNLRPFPVYERASECKLFFLYLTNALLRMEPKIPFMTFTSLVVVTEDDNGRLYSLLTQMPAFADIAYQERRQLTGSYMPDIQKAFNSKDAEALNAIDQMNFKRLMAPIDEGWLIDCGWKEMTGVSAIEVQRDWVSKSGHMKPPARTIGPLDALQTTSGMMAFVHSLLGGPIGILPDADIRLAEHPSAPGLLAAIMDKSFDFSEIFVNVDDPEDWMYRYPDFEAEVLREKERRGL